MTRPAQIGKREQAPARIGGLLGWVLRLLPSSRLDRPPGLVLRERITLAPRQTLSLVEADGRRLLIATSAEGTPAFYALEEPRPGRSQAHARRTSW
ncbi:hypothetical protein DYQ86_01760 [Acidobacteria bacterium AB60]|nr:hypothetical protein DYQ86_01760 [Acidobacteria bacterium AB60]